MTDATALPVEGDAGHDLDGLRQSALSMIHRLARDVDAELSTAAEYEARAEDAKAAGDAGLERVMRDWARPHRDEAAAMRSSLAVLTAAYRTAYGEAPGTVAGDAGANARMVPEAA